MTIDEVRTILAAHREELTALGVVSLRVFASVARGEAGPDSDVDFLSDLGPHRRISALGVAHIMTVLEDLLSCKVDLVEPQVLRAEFRDEVLAEAVDAA